MTMKTVPVTARKKYASPRMTTYGTLADLTKSPAPTDQGEDTGTGSKSGSASTP